ncbi:MAG: hypothetical protein ACOXZ4_01675 [Sphaerochaetaceae bacterium]
MSKRTASICLLFLVAQLVFSSPWVGGYRLGIDGFALPSMSVDEKWSFSVETLLLPAKTYSPSVQLGMLSPQLGSDGNTYLMVGLGMPLAWQNNHLLAPLMRRSSAWTPRIDLQMYTRLKEPFWKAVSALIQPLNFNFGDKRIGLLGVHLAYDVQDDSWGWGLRLFEIVHYLW